VISKDSQKAIQKAISYSAHLQICRLSRPLGPASPKTQAGGIRIDSKKGGAIMVIVMLWRDHTGRGHGHASLSVTRPKADGMGNESVAVITWFSAGSLAGSSAAGGLGTTTRSIPNTVEEEWRTFMAYGQERMAYTGGIGGAGQFPTEFKPPSNTCRISTLSDEDTLIGLSDANILLWWSSYKTKTDYKVLTRNCSTAVAGALIAGGGLGFATPPGFLSSIWTPSIWTPEKVFQWATQIQSKVEPINNRYREARAIIEANAKGIAEVELWDVETWKKNSAITMAHRYQVLKDIDARLGEYHEQRKEAAKGSEAVLSEAELPGLARILDKIRQQMAERPDSARRGAILHLGKQVMNRIAAIKWEATREQRALQAEQERLQRERERIETEERRMRIEAWRQEGMRQKKTDAYTYKDLLDDVHAEIAAMGQKYERDRLGMLKYQAMTARLKKVLTPELKQEEPVRDPVAAKPVDVVKAPEAAKPVVPSVPPKTPTAEPDPRLDRNQIEQALNNAVIRRKMGLEILMKAMGTEEKKAKEIQALLDKID
jgi:hypothetical protein